jgi:molybdopterin-guanine dinucleotide biosynthesis protein A
MDSNRRTLGLVLAGGLARRMGVDKAFVEVGARTLLARAAERLGAQCDAVAVNANGDAARYAAVGARVIADSISGNPGPLAGVLAGLEFAREGGFDFVVSLPVDTPFAPEDLVARLRLSRETAEASIAVACSGGQKHHAVALWPVLLADDIRHALTVERQNSVGRFCARYSVACADWPVTPFDPFFNVNTPEDVATAEELLRTNLA